MGKCLYDNWKYFVWDFPIMRRTFSHFPEEKAINKLLCHEKTLSTKKFLYRQDNFLFLQENTLDHNK